jgi:hypothetical protein
VSGKDKAMETGSVQRAGGPMVLAEALDHISQGPEAAEEDASCAVILNFRAIVG